MCMIEEEEEGTMDCPESPLGSRESTGDLHAFVQDIS